MATLVAFFRLFYSIFDRHVPKRKRSKSKPPLVSIARSCKVAPLRHSPRDAALFNFAALRNWLKQTKLTPFYCFSRLSFLVWELLGCELAKQNLTYIHWNFICMCPPTKTDRAGVQPSQPTRCPAVSRNLQNAYSCCNSCRGILLIESSTW